MRIRDAEKQALVKQKTIELIGKHGFEGFSIAKLAKACKISVATVYIYYKDKDDLIKSISSEQAIKMAEAMLKKFDPDGSLEQGIRQQWVNRFEYIKNFPENSLFYEQLRSSVYYESFYKDLTEKISPIFGKFLRNMKEREEMEDLSLEVYWAIAFGPLYSLIKFHLDGQSIGGRNFSFTDRIFDDTLKLVLKALKKQ